MGSHQLQSHASFQRGILETGERLCEKRNRGSGVAKANLGQSEIGLRIPKRWSKSECRPKGRSCLRIAGPGKSDQTEIGIGLCTVGIQTERLAEFPFGRIKLISFHRFPASRQMSPHVARSGGFPGKVSRDHGNHHQEEETAEPVAQSMAHLRISPAQAWLFSHRRIVSPASRFGMDW